MNDHIVIIDEEKDRYSRLKLIPWWNQKSLKNAKVMVVGAGALGNEILKNLALLGVGYIFLVDFDTISNSNLSRSILYREKDEGKLKTQVAADSIKEINPSVTVHPFNGDIRFDVGLGVFRKMDVIIAALDTREARLAINRKCWKVEKPWIDGAIESLDGIARVFIPPDGACYECTFDKIDYELINQKRSCALLTREEMLQNKVPTTPTIASIIAGIQTQEAVKLIHGDKELKVLNGKGFLFKGLTHESYVVEYQRRQNCPSHDHFDNIIRINESVDTLTLRALLKLAQKKMGVNAVIDLDRDIIYEWVCHRCGKKDRPFRVFGKTSEDESKCQKCNSLMDFEIMHEVTGDEDFLDKTLAEIGIPAFDIVSARLGTTKNVQFELANDEKEVLNELS